MKVTMKLLTVAALAALEGAFALRAAPRRGSNDTAAVVAMAAATAPETMCMLTAKGYGMDPDVESAIAPKDGSDKQAKLEAAIENFKKAAAVYQAAQTQLFGAMEAMLEVKALAAGDLDKVAKGSGKDTFIVFYAPWCPHCQRFVLHDGHGNPTKAPLELLRQDLQAEKATSAVEVTRVNVDEVGWDTLPKPFVVQGVPTMYFVKGDGAAAHYGGNPQDLAQLKAFVTGSLEKK
eukprot:TRINITY_DN5013_c0_g2_i1.p1 TRINITY_DN5013_c0_g2~~TRINITY_DN5013_c0_g2_i1.p1  ORF type:complete len:234 (-),score=83.61 TRINITY_DN5013_c0_g2_i1:267-968(-)